MYYPRLGVFCKACGQPIVLLDTDPGELRKLATPNRTLQLQCASCRHEKTYRFDQLLTFESADPYSGDWHRVPKARIGLD